MTRFHLLYWILKWLQQRHPGVLSEMEHDFYNEPWSSVEGSTSISTTLKERLAAWRKAA